MDYHTLGSTDTQNTETVKKVLRNIRTQVDTALRLLGDTGEMAHHRTVEPAADLPPTVVHLRGANATPTFGQPTVGAAMAMGAPAPGSFAHKPPKTILGSFDGEAMLGDDGQRYPVPPNYASKSKLIETDRLKLIITDDGKYIFKQMGPAERQRVIGELDYDDLTRQYRVAVGEKSYRVLTASVTFHHATPGDRVTLLLPMGHEAKWGAVDNVMHDLVVGSEMEETA